MDLGQRLADRIALARKGGVALQPLSVLRRRAQHQGLAGKPPHNHSLQHRYVLPVEAAACAEPVHISDDAGWFCRSRSNPSDGPDVVGRPCKVLSLRAKDNAGFDTYMREKEKCEVTGVNVLPPTRRPGHSSAAFPDDLLSPSKVERDSSLRSLDAKLKALTVGKVSVLRVDAEGAEWFFLSNLIETDWEQMIVQVHFPSRYNVSVSGSGDGKEAPGSLIVADYDAKGEIVDAYSWLKFVRRYGRVWKVSIRKENVVDLYLLRTRPVAQKLSRVINVNNALWSR